MAWVRGEQRPQKYQTTGPRYAKWGEQTHAGLAYDPETDTYHAMSPEEKISMEKELNPQPKQPGIYEVAAANTLPALVSTGGLIALNNALAPAAAASAAPAATAATTAALAPTAASIATPTGLALAPAAAAAAPEAGGLLGLGSSGFAPAAGATPLLIPGAVAAQTFLSGKTALDMLKGKEKRIDQLRMNDLTSDIPGTIGRVGLAIATGGLSEVANSLFGGHKSVKQYQQKRRQELLDKGITGLANFEETAKAQNGGGIIRDPNFQGESPYDYISVLGNYQKFGNDWDTYSLDQKARIAKALMDAGMYAGDKGDTIVDDEGQAALAVRDKVLSGELQVDPGVNPYIKKP